MSGTSALIAMGIASSVLAGCATSTTAQQEQDHLRAQIGGLQSQVAALRSQVDELHNRQQALEERTWDQGGRVRPAAETPAARRPHAVLTAKEIQLALQRAGY